MDRFLDDAVRTKLFAAWRDALSSLSSEQISEYGTVIEGRTLRSMAVGLTPLAMKAGYYPNDQLLSLIEAKHETLKILSDHFAATTGGFGSTIEQIIRAPDSYRADVNRIFEGHLIGLHLHHNSRLVPIDSSHSLRRKIAATADTIDVDSAAIRITAQSSSAPISSPS